MENNKSPSFQVRSQQNGNWRCNTCEAKVWTRYGVCFRCKRVRSDITTKKIECEPIVRIGSRISQECNIIQRKKNIPTLNRFNSFSWSPFLFPTYKILWSPLANKNENFSYFCKSYPSKIKNT